MGREAQIAEKRKGIPKMYRGIYDRAVSSKNKSFKAAITAHCLECCGWQRKEVEACTNKSCALWLLRPYQPAPDFPYLPKKRRDNLVESTNSPPMVVG